MVGHISQTQSEDRDQERLVDKVIKGQPHGLAGVASG